MNLKKPFIFNSSLTKFFRYNMNGGIILMIMAVLAMIVANSPWHDLYEKVWSFPISMQIGEFNLFSHHGTALTLAGFINDALMAVFFFFVGLEIKREILVGELSSFKRASLPVIVAFGGMIIPVVVFFIVCHNEPESIGMAIPMATDIAFSLGILSLLGNRVPIGLKIFLTAFAVVDDIGGILVIAVGYTTHLDFVSLFIGFALLGVLAVMNWLNVMQKSLYILVGVAVWFFFLQSGIHSTVAGVLVAFTIPARPRLDVHKYVDRARESIALFDGDMDENSKIITNKQVRILKNMEEYSDKVISPLQYFEDKLDGLVNYFIMPLFAFVNAGVYLGGDQSLFGIVTLAVALGLFVGKFIGLYSFTWIFAKLRIVLLPRGTTWKNLAGICMLGGVGFTVSLFIANLSFGVHYPDLLGEAKLGILLGTIISGVVGYTYLNIVLPKEEISLEDSQSMVIEGEDDDDSDLSVAQEK